MKRAFRLPFFVFAVLFLLMVTGQIALAGLSLFWRETTWETHVGLGHLVPVLPFVMLILAWVGHLPLRLRGWSGLLLGATIVQTEVFVLIRELSGFAAAFHPVLAAGLFWAGVVALQRAWVVLRYPEKALSSHTPRTATAAPCPGHAPAACQSGGEVAC